MLAGVEELITDKTTAAATRKDSLPMEEAAVGTDGLAAQPRDSSTEPGQEEEAQAAEKVAAHAQRLDSGVVGDGDEALRAGEVIDQAGKRLSTRYTCYSSQEHVHSPCLRLQFVLCGVAHQKPQISLVVFDA